MEEGWDFLCDLLNVVTMFPAFSKWALSGDKDHLGFGELVIGFLATPPTLTQWNVLVFVNREVRDGLVGFQPRERSFRVFPK
jgi:hypothetical protein